MSAAPPSRRSPRPTGRSAASLAFAVVVALVIAACGSDGDSSSVDVSIGEPAVTLIGDASAPDPAEPGDPAGEPDQPTRPGGFSTGFERVVPGGDCQCADGSEFSLFVRDADPERVLLFFQGGGACFSALTCSFTNGSFEVTADAADDPSGDEGVFDLTDDRNPFADWSIVFVPYCTGDVFLGDASVDYGGGTVVEHRGAVNARAALDELVRRYPTATEVVVAGESAGGVPAPLYAGLVSDELPDARVTAIADGSGAYPDVPTVNQLIGGLWGTEEAIPDWPVNEGLTAAEWSFPGLFVQAGRHAPDVRFARHDYVDDRVQSLFVALVGMGGGAPVSSLIDANETQIEAEGIELDSYLSPGDRHTVLSDDRFYTESVDGVALVDWVAAIVAGEAVDDVRCETCGG